MISDEEASRFKGFVGLVHARTKYGFHRLPLPCLIRFLQELGISVASNRRDDITRKLEQLATPHNLLRIHGIR